MVNFPSKIIVGITQRVDHIVDRAEFRDALDQRLVEWVKQAGFLPVSIPNTLLNSECSSETMLDNWMEAVQPNVLLLSGGNDIGEYVERDATENHLLSWAETNRMPVLGICRGMQMMTLWAGGSLATVEGHVCTRHVLQGDLTGVVNSYHNFSLASCPPGFEILACSEDGEIEAIRHTTLPWEGWMWHPERDHPINPQDVQRLRAMSK